MKKAVFAVLISLFCLVLSACAGGNVDSVEIADWQPSEIYTDGEITSAIETVKDYFAKEFDGCTLTKIGYAGDSSSDEFREWAEQYDADESIVLYSSFDVDSSGGDGSLAPNSTYDNWKWILIRDDGGEWEHATHGY